MGTSVCAPAGREPSNRSPLKERIRMPNFTVTFLTVLIALTLLGCATPTPTRNSILREIQSDVTNGRVVSVTAKAVDHGVLTTRAATIESFAQMRGRSATLQLDSNLRRELATVIENTKADGPDDNFRPDIRLGIMFHAIDGRVLHSIHCDGRYWNAIGRRALINDSCWKIRGSLIKFAERLAETGSSQSTGKGD